MVKRNPDRFVEDGGGGGGGSSVTIDGQPIDVNVTGGNVTLDATDIEIGAVELKNRSTDDRAVIDPNGDVHVHDTDALAKLTEILAQLQDTLEVEVKNDSGNPVPVNGTVAVSNMIPAVETGLAKDATVVSFAAKLPDEEGTWSYQAGTSGTEVITGRVIGIAAATAQAGGTVTINGGDAIPIPVPTSGVGSIELAPRANLQSPTIVFSATDSYVVEILS